MRIPTLGRLALGVLLTFAVFASPGFGQAMVSDCGIYKVHSENGTFYLTSVPFDNEVPSLRGKTTVYEVGRPAPLYTLDRPFHESLGEGGVFLSNDGRVIFSVLGWGAQEAVPGLKSITVYKDGALLRDFTAEEVTGCNARKERCNLVYSNFKEVVDRERSQLGTPAFHKVFKEGVSEEERFLSDFPAFASGDSVYVTDSRKIVHRFSLEDGQPAPIQRFEVVYPAMRGAGRQTRTEREPFACGRGLDFPKLASGQPADEHLATVLAMTAVDRFASDERYRLHRVFVTGVLSRDGKFKPDRLDVRGGIDREKVEGFFRDATFDTGGIPPPCDRWYLGLQSFAFRNRDVRAARRERQAEILEEQREIERRQTLDVINGVYIPRDLGDCFSELDKRLAEVDKNEMRAKASHGDMIEYHMGLGMWLRNNWGLWGGSRLQKYFTDRGIKHPDNMSGLILDYYWDWLHGDKVGWKNWEKTWRNRMPPDRPPPPPPPKQKK
jgi:hypothetical protein